MDEQKKKIIIISGIALVVLIVVLAVVVGIRKGKTTTTEKFIAPPVENIIGKITDINVNRVSIATESGDALVLAIPSSGVSFVKQKILEDGSYLNERIALFDIPKNQDIDIQYNSETNELMMIVVK
ncbi:MAG: hypothetical protein Q7U36_02290 [bacterium]|nr:hypothetical protein [bacterium]